MNIVFFGTPKYVLPVLDKLHKTFKSKSHESPIVAVVTQPPKPSGRKHKLEYSAVDTWANKRKIPIYFESTKLVKDKVKADIGIIASYGEIIPKEVIDYFPKKILNIHFSSLPKFRGASPVHAALVTGEKEIGVTIFIIDEKLDHGPIISQFKEEILPEDTVSSIRDRLFKRTAEVLITLLPAYMEGKIKPRDQEHSSATYTRMIKKDHAFIPPEYLNATLQGQSFKGGWKMPFVKDLEVKPTPEVVERFIRAMLPWPIAWTYVQLNPESQLPNLKRLKILKAHLEEKPSLKGQKSKILVLDQVQLEGKNPVSWEQFKQGYPKLKFS